MISVPDSEEQDSIQTAVITLALCAVRHNGDLFFSDENEGGK